MSVTVVAQSSFDPLGPRIPTGPGIPGIPGSGGLREVDPGVADVDPLRTSLYNTGSVADLRSPVGFDRIFVGADGRYYRISGSVVAAFDRSQYVADANGVYPEIPAGTVFYTGGLPPEALGNGGALEVLPTALLREENRVGGPIRSLATARAGDASGGAGGVGYASGSMVVRRPAQRDEVYPMPTMANDEAYRASRMAVLLRDAAADAR